MKVCFVSLGCDKNLVDSEHMLSILERADFEFTDDDGEADVIIVNTCCFIDDAMEESINSIIELGKNKTSGNCKALIVCGCLAQRYPDEIREQIPEVDGIVGTNGYDSIAEAVTAALEGDAPRQPSQLEGLPEFGKGRLVSTGGHYAYLKIAEGCDKHCTYCVIPSVRGSFRSVPLEELVLEARQLVYEGVKELILVAQEITLYGVDLYGKKSLAGLLDELEGIDGIEWIRLMYAYPEEIDDELIDAMIRNKKVCHYIDMPIQHCNDDILRRMGRRANRLKLESTIKKLRKRIPDIAIRTTVICGFPGESEEDFKELLEFVRHMRFERLGAFTYSRQEGTPAADFDDQIDDDVKQERYDRLMSLQQEVSARINEKRIGSAERVFIEGALIGEGGVYAGRSYMDAPEVDGYVFTESPYELMSGDIVTVDVTEAREYDVYGRIRIDDEPA